MSTTPSALATPSALGPKQKIAVLGGGLGSMTAVFELTEQAHWQDYYDITVYQLGWRLGGKGASGRDLTLTDPTSSPNYRIQEHGYHVFFGFYFNALGLMERCYRSLDQEGFWRSIDDAFKPLNDVVLQEQEGDQWIPWSLSYQSNTLRPWTDHGPHTFWEHVQTSLQSLLQVYTEAFWPDASPVSQQILKSLPLLLNNPKQIWESWGRTYDLLATTLGEISSLWDMTLLYVVSELGKTVLQTRDQQELVRRCRSILALLEPDHNAPSLELEHSLATKPLETRRLLMINNLAKALIRGLVDHLILRRQPLNDLDQYEFTDWLLQHGAWDTTVESAIVRVYYDLLFAFKQGIPDRAHRSLGTAAALRWMLQLNFSYSGSIIWKMQAGMGDTIFAPLYQLLKERGVKFKFFHYVTHLGLGETATSIETIQLHQQAQLKVDTYAPLIRVKDLYCWPAEPLYDQLVNGDQLKAAQVDLECFWTQGTSGTSITLQRGQDFDLVLLGISIGALPYIASELIEANPQWQAMIQHLKTVPTYGAQVWFKPDQANGIESSQLIGAYLEPFSTCADMSYLIKQETWPETMMPSKLVYLTGTLEDMGIPDPTHVNFPAQELTKLSDQFDEFMTSTAAYLWPQLHQKPPSLSVQSHYLKANVSPSERYVLSTPNSYKYRLKAGESGFSNLFLTGDWIDNSMNSGCAEATVMSGMQAVRAILTQWFGLIYERQIIGEDDSWLDLPEDFNPHTF